jgi:predicted anti-sigma-YlaC factor YlaD
MNCDHVQEVLSAFLDHEERVDEIENVLFHLYGCKACQEFFNAAVGLRHIAREERERYPSGLDEILMNRIHSKSRTNLFGYRLRLPAYVASAAAVILMAVSFTLGFMVQQNVHQKEMNAILQTPPSEVVYGMPAKIVYPAMNHQSKGGMR